MRLENLGGIPDLTLTGSFLGQLALLRLSFHMDQGETSLAMMRVNERKIAKPSHTVPGPK